MHPEQGYMDISPNQMKGGHKPLNPGGQGSESTIKGYGLRSVAMAIIQGLASHCHSDQKQNYL